MVVEGCQNNTFNNKIEVYSGFKFIDIKKFNKGIEPLKEGLFYEKLYSEYDTYSFEILNNNIKTLDDTLGLIDEIISLEDNNNVYINLIDDYIKYMTPEQSSTGYDNYDFEKKLISIAVIALYELDTFLNESVTNNKAPILEDLITYNTSTREGDLVKRAYNSLKNYPIKNKDGVLNNDETLFWRSR